MLFFMELIFLRVMEPQQPPELRKLFTATLILGMMMTRGLTAAAGGALPRHSVCNESRLQWEVEVCGDKFKRDMDHVDPQYWCNFTHFIRQYHVFTLCTEIKSQGVDCYWPNPLVESFFIHIHKLLFSNCSNTQLEWNDPPEETLTALILVPVFLTFAMIAVVVWCSKRSDLLA